MVNAVAYLRSLKLLMEIKTAKLLDGKALGLKIHEQLSTKIAQLQSKISRPPGLAVLMVGDNVGITSFNRHFPTETSFNELQEVIHNLNSDEGVDGILVQLPLPPHLDSVALLHQIDADKDVDGLHPLNLGRLLRGEPGLRSCTPAGVMRLLEEYSISLEGKQAVVLGRSILVGKPMSIMLLEANATVTMAHSRTQNLQDITKNADILVSAVGIPELISAEMVKKGAVVVDVGINRITDDNGKSRLIGDVKFDEVATVADYLTPVPGGIGPMTVAMLLENTVKSYQERG